MSPVSDPALQTSETPESRPKGRSVVARWQATPLYLRILAGVIVGVLIGAIWKEDAAALSVPGLLVLDLLKAFAPPLVAFAIVRALVNSDLKGAAAGRLAWLLATNTLVAISIGLLVANLLQPGRQIEVDSETLNDAKNTVARETDPLRDFLDNIPKSVLGPFTDDSKIIAVVILAVMFGVALRRLRNDPRMRGVRNFLEVAFEALLIILHWIIALLPFAVLCIVAGLVGVKGFEPLLSLGYFVVTVLVALALQLTFYLTRIRLGSWARPIYVLRGMRDALLTAFSTASSNATMPVTYQRLRDRVGVREESASMGAMVGSNFNNDGTALYEAVAALFVSQLIGRDLTVADQLLVVLLSVVASVGAAGIPEAGIVTMVLVFETVGLPISYISTLLAVDWFLDRCRTTLNVMGDITVSCLLDGKRKAAAAEPNTNDER